MIKPKHCSAPVKHIDNSKRHNHLRLNDDEVNRSSRAEKQNLILRAEAENPQPDKGLPPTQPDWRVSHRDSTWRHHIFEQQGVPCSEYVPLLLVHQLVHCSNGFVDGGLLACRDVELRQVVGNNATFAERGETGAISSLRLNKINIWDLQLLSLT